MPKPMLATLIKEPFDSPDWIFETKWDGYRALGQKEKATKLLSRNGLSFNKRFPTLVEALEKLPGKFIVDGEIVIFDKKGISHFQLLQNYQREKKGTPYYYLFDLLSLNRKSLTHLPLTERRELLKKLLKRTRSPHLRFSASINAKGKALFAKAKRQGWEGIIAKRKESLYLSKRSRDWLKIKAEKGQEVVIGGYTPPKGSRIKFGALLIGVYNKGKFLYAGRIGTGFDRKLLTELFAKMQPLRTKTCPFASSPKGEITWIKPKLVCEVSFTEWTKDGLLRHPVFKGLRMDKSPRSVQRESYA